MIVETDDQSKLKELRKNQGESYTVKTNEHMPIGFALAIYYLEDIEHENEYFCYIVKDCSVTFHFKLHKARSYFQTKSFTNIIMKANKYS